MGFNSGFKGLKFRPPHHNVPRCVRGDIFRHISFYLRSSPPSPSPLLPSQNPFNLPPCYLAHSRLHCTSCIFHINYVSNCTSKFVLVSTGRRPCADVLAVCQFTPVLCIILILIHADEFVSSGGFFATTSGRSLC